MKKLVIQTLCTFTILSTSVFSSAPLDWTDHTSLYWFESDGTELERGFEVRDSTALTGIATITDERFERGTQTWLPAYSDYHLDTSNGNWVNEVDTYAFEITGDNNEILELSDGFARLDNVINIDGQTAVLSNCFDIPVTFSTGAEKFDLSWKNKEEYGLWRVPTDWQTQTPYSTLNAFMEADQPFLYNGQSGQNGGFGLDANLSDGSGDLVILTMDGSGNWMEGQPIGTWSSSYTLPGQATASIKFTITDPEFTDEETDYLFATIHESIVWMGGHQPAGTVFEVVDDGFIGNEIAYNAYMTAMAPYDFTKMVNCDIGDKKIDTLIEQYHLQTSYYANMNFWSEIEITQGTWIPYATGTWSVENGILVNDSVANDLNKTVSIFEISNQTTNIVHTTTGRGELISRNGQMLGYPMNLTETDIPHRLSVSDIKGKKVSLTYQETGEDPETGTAYFFDNMTFSFEDSGDDVGVWRIENGILLLDTYWIGDDGTTIETGTESWVFDSATEAKVYEGITSDATIVFDNVTDITGSDSIPPNFSIDTVPHIISVSTLAGKKVIVGDPDIISDQDTIYFYENMTYRQETHDDNGIPETITGAWSVEEGVVIVDVVYSDNVSAHYVIAFDEAPGVGTTFAFMEVVSQGTERDEGIPIVSVSDIPEETENSGVSPAVIMYLLN